jgi:DNA adenine methylase
VLRERPRQLIDLLKLTPYSREEYEMSWEEIPFEYRLERARRFFVRARQSYAGLGAQQRTKGWNYAKASSRVQMSEAVSKWLGGIDKLIPVIERLRSIQLENDSFENIIPRYDDKYVFFYCDPPYDKESRSGNYDYKFEFDIEKHEHLSSLLNQIQGKCMVSGYDSKLMHKLYPKRKGWHMRKGNIKNNNMRNGEVQECIWMNYDPDKIYHQATIYDLMESHG